MIDAPPAASPAPASPLAPAIIVADVCLALALALALRDAFPEALGRVLRVEVVLGLAAVAAAIALLVAMPIRALRDADGSDAAPAPAPFGEALSDAFGAALAVVAVPLPLLAATVVLCGASIASAAPLLGGLVVMALVGAAASAAAPRSSRARHVPLGLAALVFFTAGPLAVLLEGERDLHELAGPVAAAGGSPLHAVDGAARSIADVATGEASAALPDGAAPADVSAEVASVDAPPGGLFRPGRPAPVTLEVAARGLDGEASIALRTSLGELGARLPPPGAARTARVRIPAVLDPGGLGAARVVVRTAAGDRLDVAWPDPLPPLTAVPAGVITMGHVGGSAARRLASRVTPEGVPVRDAAVPIEALAGAPQLIAETYDVIIIGERGAADGPTVSADGMAERLRALAAAGALVLVADDAVAGALARAEPALAAARGGLPAAPARGRVGAGAASRIDAADAESARPLVARCVAARRADDALRAGLADEVTLTLAIAETPRSLGRRVGIAATLAQAALLLGLLLLRARPGRGALGIAVAVGLGACVPVWLAAPPSRAMATVAAILRAHEGSPLARRDEAVALSTFARRSETATVGLVGPAPWPGGGRQVTPDPDAGDALPRSRVDDGGARVALVARPGWPGAFVRAGVADIGAVSVASVPGGGAALVNGTSLALADAVLLDASGVRPLGAVAPGGRVALDAGEVVSRAAFRAKLTGEERLRFDLVGPWVDGIDLGEERVLVAWALAEDPVSAGATLVGARNLALVVTLRRWYASPEGSERPPLLPSR